MSSDLSVLHQANGAKLAPDQIPLDFGNLAFEYQQAHESAVLLDRSHEGRLHLTGKTRFDLINRMSTNKTDNLPANSGCATLFTNATARIIDRVEVYHLGDELLVLTQPPRRPAVEAYLKRNIFFNDDVQLQDKTAETHQFALHGAQAQSIIQQLVPSSHNTPLYHIFFADINGIPLTIMPRKAFVGTHWMLITPREHGVALWQTLTTLPNTSVTPAGSLLHNVMRIEAGSPAINELNEDFIPLELGLWDEVSFHKGCYTGQEIIARMDSREKLARVAVAVVLDKFVPSPAPITKDGTLIGTLTSSVTTPDGRHCGIAIVKTTFAQPNSYITVGNPAVNAKIRSLLGTQPLWVTQNQG